MTSLLLCQQLSELTLPLGGHVDLDATDEDGGELFHLLQGASQPVPVHLVGQLLLPTVHLLRHLGQHWTQVLAGRQGEYFQTNIELNSVAVAALTN